MYSTMMSQQIRRSSLMSEELPPAEGRTPVKEEYVEGNLKICESIELTREAMCLKFTPDGTNLAVGQADGVIKIFNSDTGQCHHSLSDDDVAKSKLPVTSIRLRPSSSSDKVEHRNMLSATYASGIIKFWHYTSGKAVQTIHENRQILGSAYNTSGNRFITCGADPQIYIYDVDTKKRVRVLESSDSRDVMNGHRDRVFSVQFHPHDQHVFISGGWDDTVQFWDDRQKHAIRRIYGPHICGDSLDIDPVHNHIVSGSWRKDNVLQIWDFNTGEKLKDVPQDHLHGSLLYCAQWLGKENIICGGCDQNMARIIDRGTLNTVGQLVDLPAGVYCLDNDRQPKPRIAVGAAKKAYILKMEKRVL